MIKLRNLVIVCAFIMGISACDNNIDEPTQDVINQNNNIKDTLSSLSTVLLSPSYMQELEHCLATGFPSENICGTVNYEALSSEAMFIRYEAYPNFKLVGTPTVGYDWISNKSCVYCEAEDQTGTTLNTIWYFDSDNHLYNWKISITDQLKDAVDTSVYYADGQPVVIEESVPEITTAITQDYEATLFSSEMVTYPNMSMTYDATFKEDTTTTSFEPVAMYTLEPLGTTVATTTVSDISDDLVPSDTTISAFDPALLNISEETTLPPVLSDFETQASDSEFSVTEVPGL